MSCSDYQTIVTHRQFLSGFCGEQAFCIVFGQNESLLISWSCDQDPWSFLKDRTRFSFAFSFVMWTFYEIIRLPFLFSECGDDLWRVAHCLLRIWKAEESHLHPCGQEWRVLAQDSCQISRSVKFFKELFVQGGSSTPLFSPDFFLYVNLVVKGTPKFYKVTPCIP